MSLSSSILKTLLYHHRFDSGLILDQLHLCLISPRIHSRSTFKKQLDLLLKKNILILKNNHYFLSHLTYSPRPDSRHYQNKLKFTQNLLPIFKKFPFLNFVGVTGSVAAAKPKKKDDVDLLFIVQENTLWLFRPLFLLILKLKNIPFRHSQHPQKPNHFCPNILLDYSGLTIPKNRRNITTATDLILLTPIFDRGDYHRSFLKKNSWAKKYLANGYHQKLKEIKSIASQKSATNNIIFSLLNLPFFIVQYLYMLPKKRNETITFHQAIFTSPKK